MTNEIIYIQDYALIVSDEQAKENDWGYIPFEGGQVKLIGKFFADDWRKVIGYRPLNHSAWILEGVPLLPDFGLGDDVLQQPKLPNTFECEMTQLLPNESFGLDYGSSNLKPKTTTNSQGKTELVGQYIF